MKNIKAIALALAIAFISASCERQCRCYHYNGTMVTFTEEELDAMGESCRTMEDFNRGLTYSYCEWDF